MSNPFLAAASELRIAAERAQLASHAPALYADQILEARKNIDAALKLLGLDTAAELSADLSRVQLELDATCEQQNEGAES